MTEARLAAVESMLVSLMAMHCSEEYAANSAEALRALAALVDTRARSGLPTRPDSSDPEVSRALAVLLDRVVVAHRGDLVLKHAAPDSP